MIDPKEIEINGRKYILHKFGAVAGRHIVTQYPIANIPKIGNYEASQELMEKLMSFVTVKLENGNEIALETAALIDNHVPDAVTLIKLEKAMMQYNFDFLADGEISRILDLVLKVADRKITQMLTLILQSSSDQEEPLSGN